MTASNAGTATATSAGTSTWTIDPTHTGVEFAVRHMMIATVRGRFSEVAGTLILDEAEPKRSSVKVTIGVASIDTRADQRDGHLRSPDFFDAERFPAMTFRGKRMEGDFDSEFRLTGDLTIRDVTREVTLDVENQGRGRDPWGGERIGFQARGKIDRTDFGLRWNQALEAGGVLVSDEVRLTIDAQLVRATEG